MKVLRRKQELGLQARMVFLHQVPLVTANQFEGRGQEATRNSAEQLGSESDSINLGPDQGEACVTCASAQSEAGANRPRTSDAGRPR